MPRLSYIVKVGLDEDERRYEPRCVLTVEHNGIQIRYETDGGEAEDQSFSRNWSWVAPALCEAYSLGVTDGSRAVVTGLLLNE